MELQKAIDALASNRAAKVDVTSFSPSNPGTPPEAPDDDYERQVALG